MKNDSTMNEQDKFDIAVIGMFGCFPISGRLAIGLHLAMYRKSTGDELLNFG
jgi:hypothetical protein